MDSIDEENHLTTLVDWRNALNVETRRSLIYLLIFLVFSILYDQSIRGAANRWPGAKQRKNERVRLWELSWVELVGVVSTWSKLYFGHKNRHFKSKHEERKTCREGWEWGWGWGGGWIDLCANTLRRIWKEKGSSRITKDQEQEGMLGTKIGSRLFEHSSTSSLARLLLVCRRRHLCTFLCLTTTTTTTDTTITTQLNSSFGFAGDWLN